MDKPKVSVIVPVYNVEKFLRRCLDSVVGQTLRDIEILLINDGSQDGSLDIIHEYAERDSRINVIDKPNEGYGKTMNLGIDTAIGEYIGIVESDDWIEPDMYETLYGIAKKHCIDAVKSRFTAFEDTTGRDIRTVSFPKCDVEQVIDPRRSPAIFCVLPSIWSAIYRREFLTERRIRFLETPGASFQDTSFNYKVWAMAETAYLHTKPLVHYRKHTNQSVDDKDKVFCICDEYEEIERYMASFPVLFEAMKTMFNRIKYNHYLWNFKRLSGENREIFRKRMQEELIPALERHKIDLSGMDSRERLRLLRIIYPESMEIRIRFALGGLTRCLVRDRHNNGFMETRILFGLIPVRKTPINHIRRD